LAKARPFSATVMETCASSASLADAAAAAVRRRRR